LSQAKVIRVLPKICARYLPRKINHLPHLQFLYASVGHTLSSIATIAIRRMMVLFIVAW